MQINVSEHLDATCWLNEWVDFLRSPMNMSREEVGVLVRRVLASVAPESESEPIDPEADFRDQLDIDSMDFLNFVTAMHEATGLDIPEKDYPQLASLNGCIEYLEVRIGER